MNWSAAYGLLAHGVIFGALAGFLPAGQLRNRAALVATTIALLGGIAPFMHALFGAPSTTLLALAVLRLAGHTPSPLNRQAAGGLLLLAALFYPLSLGLSSFDPYALGYQPWGLLSALVPIGVALWLRRQDGWLFILALDLAAYGAGLFDNLWDALLDPLLILIAGAVVLRAPVIRGLALIWARRR